MPKYTFQIGNSLVEINAKDDDEAMESLQNILKVLAGFAVEQEQEN